MITLFFNYLTLLGAGADADSQSLQEYVANDCVIESNEIIVCRGLGGILDYTKKMQQKYERVSYSDFLEAPIMYGDKAVIHFHVSCLGKDGTKSILNAIAILTFKNGKIAYWNEIYCEL
jgi:hypothetical protein